MPSITAQCALVNRLAARQHQLVTRPQLLAAGITKMQVEEWQRTKFLTRVERGVFSTAGADVTWLRRVLAVCLAGDGIASHRSAAALHGVEGGSRGRPEITIPDGQSFRRPGIRTHESKDLHLINPVVREGIPTTPVARTVLDLGAVNRFAVEDAARDAVSQRLTTWAELFATLVAHSRKGRSGCGPLRAVLDEHYGDQSESNLERRFLRLIRLAGLPAPAQQFVVADSHGDILRVDFGYPQLLIAIEIDSVQFHSTAKAFEHDRAKRNRLKLLGWLLLEFTSRAIRHRPVAVCEEVATAIRAQQAFCRQPGLPRMPG